MIAALVACEEPHALVLSTRMHEETTDPATARAVGEAYAKAALRGHPGGHQGGHLAFARNHAGKGTDAGNVAAYAHLIEYGWITGGGPLLEEAMRRHVRKLSEAQELEAHEETARWRWLRSRAQAPHRVNEPRLRDPDSSFEPTSQMSTCIRIPTRSS